MRLTGSVSGLTIDEAKEIFVQAKFDFPVIHKDRIYEEWAAYMQNSGFIAYQESRIQLTTLGADLMHFLIDQRLVFDRIG